MRQFTIDKVFNKHFMIYRHFFATRKGTTNYKLITINYPTTRGVLLLELLLAISILAVILSVGTQAIFVSMQSSKISGERDVALALANEGVESLRAISDEKWQNIYSVTGKGTTHYYSTSTVPAGKWTIFSGDETIILNGIVYTRYIIIDNVSRDPATRAIETTYNSNNDDPSTQKGVVTVSWPSADPVTIPSYHFRWKNKVCVQTAWLGNGGSGNNLRTCPATDYDLIGPAVSATTSLGNLELR